MDILLALSQLFLMASFIYFIFTRDAKEREQNLKQQTDLQKIYSQTVDNLSSNQMLIMDNVSAMQQEFFKQISSHSTKSQQTLEKLSLNLVKLSIDKLNKSEPVVREVKKIDNFDLATSGAVPLGNPIEKEDEPESDLADMPRIPLISGVKLQFEDEPGQFPVDISPVGSVTPNPIFDTPTNNVNHGT